jgi:isopentenyl phosphate kinase
MTSTTNDNSTTKQLIYLKLGGSLITDKNSKESANLQILQRCGVEIKSAMNERPTMRLLIGHGAGSYGHVVAKQYDTINGVSSDEQWHGFCLVQDAMLRLNVLVRSALSAIDTVSFFPHDFLMFSDGVASASMTQPIAAALRHNIVPLVCGDPVLDTKRGGTICSTEVAFATLAACDDRSLRPDWLLFAGDQDGVLDADSNVIPTITSANYDDVKQYIGGSASAIDTTGGMASKVCDMLALVKQINCQVLIFNGLKESRIKQALIDPSKCIGTVIKPI